MELNYQNIDERGFSRISNNSNFNPDQDSDLPYSPKIKNKAKTNKMLYEDDSRPVVDKNAAYFANLRKVC